MSGTTGERPFGDIITIPLALLAPMSILLNNGRNFRL